MNCLDHEQVSIHVRGLDYSFRLYSFLSWGVLSLSEKQFNLPQRRAYRSKKKKKGQPRTSTLTEGCEDDAVIRCEDGKHYTKKIKFVKDESKSHASKVIVS